MDVLHALTNPAKSEICYHADIWFLSSILFSLLGATCFVFIGLEGLRRMKLIWGKDANCQAKVLPNTSLLHQTVFYQISAAGKVQKVTPNGNQIRHPH